MGDMAYCDTLYTAHDEHGLASCFLVAWEGKQDAVEKQTAFLGLSAARPDHQGRMTTTRLYRAFIDDARARETSGEPPVLVWCTSASQTVIPLFARLFTGVQPALDLSFDPARHSELDLACDLFARKQGRGRETTSQHADPDYPFVLRGVSPMGAFSAAEEERQRSLATRRPAGPLRDLDLESSDGDRMILIGRVS